MAFDTQHCSVQLVLCAAILGCVTTRENETTACNVIHVAYTKCRKWHVTYDDSPFMESSTGSEHMGARHSSVRHRLLLKAVTDDIA